jgi:hypothetical protein
MAGNSNQKILSARGAPPFNNDFKRQGFFPEMNSSGIRCQRDIQPVIDQNTGSGPARFRDGEAREFQKSARLEMLLANLNPIGSRRNRPPYGIVKQAPAK